jgi:formate/nitrite transporter FocA (FNT family)
LHFKLESAQKPALSAFLGLTGMIDHQRVCAWLHVLSGVAIMVLLSASLAYVASQFASSEITPQVKSLLGSIGLAIGTSLCIVAGAELIGGVAFLASKPMGRPLLLLSSAFHVINVPLGTALAVYTYWSFFRGKAQLPAP